MEKSDSIDNISVALVEAQSEMPAVKMNKRNPFLKNRYADLGALIETAQPILAKHGLAISQICTSNEGYIGVETVLLHKSGEWISSTMELPALDEKGKSNSQVAGSIITYIRRYSLAAILGMYADEDGDGNAPQPIVEKAKEERPKVAELVKSKPKSKKSKRKAEVEEFEDAEEPEVDSDGYECTCPEACPIEGHPIESEDLEEVNTIIPESVIDGVKNVYDALDKIQGYAMMNGLKDNVMEVILECDPKYPDRDDINDVPITKVRKIVLELTGRRSTQDNLPPLEHGILS